MNRAAPDQDAVYGWLKTHPCRIWHTDGIDKGLGWESTSRTQNAANSMSKKPKRYPYVEKMMQAYYIYRTPLKATEETAKRACLGYGMAPIEEARWDVREDDSFQKHLFTIADDAVRQLLNGFIRAFLKLFRGEREFVTHHMMLDGKRFCETWKSFDATLEGGKYWRIRFADLPEGLILPVPKEVGLWLPR
jgi:hypothetical protein